MVGQGNQPVKEKQRETMRASEWGWGVCKGGKMQPTARVQPAAPCPHPKKEAKKSRKADRATSYSPKKRDAKAVQKEEGKKRAYGTPDSHVVPHRSTDRACSGLTAQFGRDTVRFTEYGRRRVQQQNHSYM